jgi:predicted phage terminase large subunit-like protein
VTAVSFTGSITGQGADFIIVDDPHKISDATSPEQIEKTIETFNSTVESRLDDPEKGQILVLAHRISREDLSGALINQGGWHHLRLPIIAETDLEFVLGDMVFTLPKGNILRRKGVTLEKIEGLRKKTTRPNFRTLYLQDPTELDDPILPEDFTFFKKLPLLIGGTLISVDWAQGDKPLSSYSVIQVWRVVEGKYCLADQARARMPYDVLAAKLRSMVNRYRTSIVLIESGGPAHALALELRRMGGAAPKSEIISTGGKSKQERFESVKPFVKQGLVSLPHSAEWVSDFIEEVTSFPNVENNDQVDAAVHALKWLTAGNLIPPRPPRCMAVLGNARSLPPRAGARGAGGGPLVFTRHR